MQTKHTSLKLAHCYFYTINMQEGIGHPISQSIFYPVCVLMRNIWRGCAENILTHIAESQLQAGKLLSPGERQKDRDKAQTKVFSEGKGQAIATVEMEPNTFN